MMEGGNPLRLSQLPRRAARALPHWLLHRWPTPGGKPSTVLYIVDSLYYLHYLERKIQTNKQTNTGYYTGDPHRGGQYNTILIVCTIWREKNTNKQTNIKHWLLHRWPTPGGKPCRYTTIFSPGARKYWAETSFISSSLLHWISSIEAVLYWAPF